MPAYKIHRLKPSQYEHFRWAPHTSGSAQVRPKDYEAAGEIEAQSVYAAWSQLKDEDRPLRVGDLLESGEGGLRIFKYVGFEEAQWVAPEPEPVPTEPIQKA